MNRVYNFSAGPSMPPLPVLERAQKELVCYGDTGMSVMEMSHRSKMYEEIIAKAEADLRTLMRIPENYKVLFLQGGASMQFAQVPLNLLSSYKTGKADYINSGNFANLAIKEAKKYADVKEVASSKDIGYTQIRTGTRRSSAATRTTSTSAATTRSTVRATPGCPRPAACRWWRTCPPASSRRSTTSPSSASPLPARRRTSARRA